MPNPKLNIVSTLDAAGVTQGRIRSAYMEDRNSLADYGTNGFLEFGDGTDGSLPFKVDQAGNAVANSIAAPSVSTASAPILTGVAGTNGGGGVQLSDKTRDYMVYLQIGTAGTAFVLEMGHTSAANDVTIHASAAGVANSVISFRLPAGWYFAWSATSTTLTQSVAVGC